MSDPNHERRPAPRSGAHSTVIPEWSRGQRGAAVAGPALVVAALAVAILLWAARYREAREWVAHTRAVLSAARTTLSHVQDAETGQRGYLLTGDSTYLAPYSAAARAVAADAARLRSLTEDNPDQQRRLDTLSAVIRAKFAELDSTVRLHRAGQPEAALAVVRTDVGRVLMDSIRVQVRAVIATEEALLERRQRAEDRAARATVTVVVVGAVLAALLAWLTNRLLAAAASRHAGQARDIAEQADELALANEQLQEQQTELEIQSVQLQEQQAELEATNEHLQDQATELEAQQAELEMQTEELTSANAELTLANGRLAETVRQLGAAEARARVLFDAEHAARDAAELARAEAEAANRAKSQFLSTMSHELRTPLNGIGGYTQLIELGIHGPVTDEQRTALGRITRAQQHLLSLINDILNLSRIEAGKVEYDVQEVALAEAVADVVTMVEPQVAAKHMTLDVPAASASNGLDAGAPLLVWADRDRLRQVLLNLLGNATKFMADGGRIAVTVAARPGRPDEVELRVRDTGYGIPAPKLAAIFEPFVQLHRDVTGASALGLQGMQGTGLGLAISRDLMRGMGGDIEVESAVGEGSTFVVVLRRVVTAAGAPTDRRTGDERRLEDERRSGAERRHEELEARQAEGSDAVSLPRDA